MATAIADSYLAPLGFVITTVSNRVMFGRIGGFYLAAVLTVVGLDAAFVRDRKTTAAG